MKQSFTAGVLVWSAEQDVRDVGAADLVAIGVAGVAEAAASASAGSDANRNEGAIGGAFRY